MRSSSTEAGSSLGSCLTNLPSIAYWRIDFFSFSANVDSSSVNCFSYLSYSWINGSNELIFSTIRCCSSSGGRGKYKSSKSSLLNPACALLELFKTNDWYKFDL
ncbi:hypothetical protein AMIKIPNL_00598 [Mycoplasmopsis arginini]|nr:hypothetical protein [Mycoplasmopsis arginini]